MRNDIRPIAFTQFAVLAILFTAGWVATSSLLATIAEAKYWALHGNLLGATSTPTPTDASTETATPTPQASPTPVCGLTPTVPTSPNPGEFQYFNAIAALSSNDVWAVGQYEIVGPGESIYHPLIVHWDGNHWVTMYAPDVGEFDNYLNGVVAISSSDIWAVGSSSDGSLVLHWNGAEWSHVSISNLGSAGELYAINALSSNDVWAVGAYSAPGGGQTLALHWDGTNWSIVPTPNIGAGSNSFRAVTALATNDIWAVGYYYSSTNAKQTLVEHWNGTSWSIVPSPNLAGNNALLGVAGISANDVWAVGGYDNFVRPQSLTLHWDGISWTQVPSPNPANNTLLYGITALSSTNLWAVGVSHQGSNSGRTLVIHWDGFAWDIVPSPNFDDTYTSELVSVAAASPGDIYAVGNHHAYPNPLQTLIIRYNDPCDTCVIGFSDVRLIDYFYTPIRYLYCHNVISGYSDGTFRPYNNTSRGQLCKMVTLAEGWAINTEGGPHFTDVPLGSTFYNYVETAFNHGIIAGYGDGTFRPSNDVTRGQLCKIIVTARGWPIDTSGGPHFTDVPVGSTFYPYIETAYHHSIISGYGGGVFRPGNSATRGQISKILYNAVSQP